MQSQHLIIVLGVAGFFGAILIVSAVWASWRMTWAHERIARHVGEIERLVTEHVKRAGTRE